MPSEARTMSELRERLIEKADVDEAFRARLLSDPKAAVREELGLTIPAGFTLKVHEDVQDTSHLVLPPLARLDESALEQAAGGTEWSGPHPRDDMERRMAGSGYRGGQT